MKKSLVSSMAVVGILAGLLLGAPADAAAVPPNMTGLVIGADGALYTSIRRTFASGGSPVWDRPVPASPQAIAPPGAGISAARFPDGNIAAFYVDLDGVMQTSYTTGLDQWQPPTPITVAGDYLPGAQIVTVKSPIGVDAIAVDRNNWIYVVRADFRVPPLRWMGIPAPWTVNIPSGAPLSAQPLPGGDLLIAFIDSGGSLTMLRLTSAGTWLTPTRLTNTGAATPGSTVKMVLVGTSPIIFWIDTAGFTHKMTPVGSRPADQRLTGVPSLPVTAGLSPVTLPNGQVALFFVGSNSAVDVLLTNSMGGQSGPFTLTTTQTIPPGSKLELALTAGSSSSRYDIDGDLCPTPPPWPWPWPWPWPPRGAWADLAVTISSSGSIVSSRLGTIGLTDNVITGGNVTTVA